MTSTIEQRGDLDLSYDSRSGQLLRVFDRRLGMEVVAFQPGCELEVNGLPLPTTLAGQDANPQDPAWQCLLSAVSHPAVGCAQGFDIMRQVVVGSACKPWGNHINPPRSLHLRYRFERKRVDRYADPVPHSASPRPIQMPLWLDTIGTCCARSAWFGPETRLLQAAIGGCGPKEHVGLIDAPLAEAVEPLWNQYRRTHPGVQSIPGAVLYHPDGRWLWITCQRPTVGMHWDFATDRIAARFQFHARLDPAEIVHPPEVSLHWGRGGRAEFMAVLNAAFIAYEEPSDWFYRTTWFWLHWWQYRERGYDDMVEQVKFLHGELGLTGFGLTSHDVRPGAWDCGPSGLRPSPHLGGEAGLRRLGRTVRDLGGRMFVWLPFLGLSAPSLDLKDHWRLRGEDGRPYESFSIGSYDMYHGVNFGHPEVQEYYLGWIRRYIRECGIDGIFWDCGGTPQPPDFSPAATRPFQRFPSESMTAAYRFMERVMQVGRECSPDFFMWHECFGTDLPGTGYSTHTGDDLFADELNQHGRQRLVYRSQSTYNLYGGIAAVKPGSDCAFRSPATVDTYRPMAADAMNRWVVRFVREHGIRDARALAKGVALCAGHVVVDPGTQDRVVAMPPGVRRLVNAIDGRRLAVEAGAVHLPPDSAWVLE